MAGVVGKSGRRTNFYEIAIASVNDTEIPEILLKSAKAVNKFFDDTKVSLELKAELGARFLMKAMPQTIHAQSSEVKFTEIVHKFEGLDTEALRAIGQACINRTLSTRADGISEIGPLVDSHEVGRDS